MAMKLTIQMLYLVEFADWNCQTTIGYGCGDSANVVNMGGTDEMPYHTGTMQASRETYGAEVQYRYIENPWGNGFDWLDGCYLSSGGLSTILNPADFSDTENGTLVGTPVSGYPKIWAVSLVNGVQWLYPQTVGGSYSKYVPDCWYYDSTKPCLYSGGNGRNNAYGLFFIDQGDAGYANKYVSCRLMVLPAA
jgi:hypothetical protein